MKIEIRKGTPKHMRDWIKKLVKKHGWTYERIKKSSILREYVVDKELIIDGTMNGDPSHMY